MAKRQTVKKKNVIFVCTGNTCRSPMAENIFKSYLGKKRKLSRYNVSSAGLGVNSGDSMTDNAISALKMLKITVRKKHAAHLLTVDEAKNADLIVCMTASHKFTLREFGDKVKTVGEITGAHDVPDPYGGDLNEYLKTAEYLMYACDDILTVAESIGNT